MYPKQRFQAWLQRERLGHVPVDYLAKPELDRRLLEHFDVKTEKELLDCLKADFYYHPHRDIRQNERGLSVYQGPELKRTATRRTCPLAGMAWKSPREVIDHTRETVAALSAGGGYVLGSSQILDVDIPVENVVAMYCDSFGWQAGELNGTRAHP